MPQKSKLPDNWRELLKEDDAAARAKKVSAEYRKFVTELDNALAKMHSVPKTSTLMYVDHRTLYILREIAQRESVSLQSLYREGMAYVISRRLGAVGEKTNGASKNRGSTRKRVSKKKA